VLARWQICSKNSRLASRSSTKHTPDRFIRDAILPSHLAERFSLLHTTEYRWPLRRRNLPMGIICCPKSLGTRDHQRISESMFKDAIPNVV
jgi:hypothetical protein